MIPIFHYYFKQCHRGIVSGPSGPNPKTDWRARSSRAIDYFFNKDVMEETVNDELITVVKRSRLFLALVLHTEDLKI